MPYTLTDINTINKGYSESAFKAQQHRHQDWTTNYTLYRDKVAYNRLTQRQSVNVPLMKYVLKSALKEVDDPIDLYFNNKDNDKQKEIFYNEYFQIVRTDQKIDVRDIGDKKQVLMYGSSSSDWNIENGKVIYEIDDRFDVFVDQFTDPFDVDGTCHFMEHRHIFKTLKSLKANPAYDRAAIARLEQFYATAAGLVKSAENQQSMAEKNQRAQDIGTNNVTDPEVGETYVEVSKRWTKLWDEEHKQEEIYYSVAADTETLLAKRQEEVIGETTDHYWRTHFTKTIWADDVERNDNYPDGVADMIRPINIIVNAYLSQGVENGTLKNFNMMFYDSTDETFIPQTWEAEPWGKYPVPVGAGKTLADMIQPMPVGDLSDVMPSIQFLIGIAEKAAATSATQSGQVNQNKVTLGEIELVLQEAKDRLKTMSNYFIPAWKERGTKFIKLLEAAGDRLDVVQSAKKGYRGNMFTHEISPDDWWTPNGYTCEVTSKAEVRAQAVETINTLNAVRAAMPGNTPLEQIYEEKMLDLIPGLTPDQIRLVTDFQKQKRELESQQNKMMMANGMGMPVQQPIARPAAAPMVPMPGQQQQPQPGTLRA